MRKHFVSLLQSRFARRPFFFFTGDLGFATFEQLREQMGPRFVNAGVAEQNMVGVAAGAAATGEECWVYSIAPFLYARAFEQIRNDLCMQKLPVRLVGNGGGYGYGAQGPTHHGLEDYGVLSMIGIRSLIPAFDPDLETAVTICAASPTATYLRLGLDESPSDFAPPEFRAWRHLVDGAAGVLVLVGPLAGSLLAPLSALDRAERPDTWLLSEVPIRPDSLPEELTRRIARCDLLAVAEEHVSHGGAGHSLLAELARLGSVPPRFEHRSAAGYPSGTYGSQKFHRAESSLDPRSVLEIFSPEARAVGLASGPYSREDA